jgi:hypothetical protein
LRKITPFVCCESLGVRLQVTVECVAVTMHICILVYMVLMVVREFIYCNMQKLDTEYQGTVCRADQLQTD